MCNPWDVPTLMQFNFFECPSCGRRDRDMGSFRDHAIQSHEEAKQIWDGKTSPAATMEWESLDVKYCGSDEFIPGTVIADWEDEEALPCDDNEMSEAAHWAVTAVECDLDEAGAVDHKSIPKRLRIIGKVLAHNRIKCLACEATFDNVSKMTAHMMSEHPKKGQDVGAPEARERRYKCDQCPTSKTFRNKLKLDAHVLRVHKQCEATLDNVSKMTARTMSERSKTEKDDGDPEAREWFQRPVKCDQCPTSKTYRNKFDLDTHVLHVHRQLNHGVSVCDQCGENVGGSTDNWKRHLVTVHNDETLGATCPDCPDSTKRYWSRGVYMKHRSWVHCQSKDFVCDTCGKRFIFIRTLRQHIRDVHGNTRKCPLCELTFSGRYRVGVHMKRMHPEVDIAQANFDEDTAFCPECSICLPKENLDDHRLKFHFVGLDNSRFKCNQCDALLTSYPHKRRHTKTIHEDKCTIVCDMCSVGFYTHREYNIHTTRRHSDTDRLKCKYCGLMLYSELVLMEHCRKNHPEKSEEFFRCDVCNKSLSTRNALLSHKRRNICATYVPPDPERHHCHVCGANENSFVLLKAHMKAEHNGEKCQYKCKACLKILSSETALHLHKLKYCHPTKFTKSKKKGKK